MTYWVQHVHEESRPSAIESYNLYLYSHEYSTTKEINKSNLIQNNNCLSIEGALLAWETYVYIAKESEIDFFLLF